MLEQIDEMITSCRQVRHTDDLSIVVGPDTAFLLLREAFVAKNKKIEFTDDTDELFIYDGIPVVMRVEASREIATLVKIENLPKQSCCDQTAMRVLAVAISMGKS